MELDSIGDEENYQATPTQKEFDSLIQSLHKERKRTPLVKKTHSDSHLERENRISSREENSRNLSNVSVNSAAFSNLKLRGSREKQQSNSQPILNSLPQELTRQVELLSQRLTALEEAAKVAAVSKR